MVSQKMIKNTPVQFNANLYQFSQVARQSYINWAAIAKVCNFCTRSYFKKHLQNADRN